MGISAFTEMYGDHRGLIDGCAVQYEKDPELRRDLRQEIWLEVYSAHPSFKGESDIKTWLWVIAERVCKDYVARDVGRRVDTVPDSSLTLPQSESDEDEAVKGSWIEQCVPSGLTAEDEQLLGELMMRAATLSEQEAAVFNLVYWHGLSYVAVAKKLGVSIDTIGPIVGRLRSKLEVKDLYHKAYTYHAPGTVWGDWAWKPEGPGNKRMEK